MKKIILLFSIVTLAFVTSCTNNEESNHTENSSDKNAIIINDNQTQLKQRLNLTNSGVISILNASTKRNLATESSQLPLTQIGEFNAPKDSQGRTLQATHVAVNGNYAYVSYALQGNEYSGAIDMIDVSDPYKPALKMSALISDTDISSVVYSNGKLLIAGAADVDKNSNIKTPAVVMTIQLASDGSLTTNATLTDITSYAATDITANSSNYFAVSGVNGSLYKFDNITQQAVGNVAIEDLRAVAAYNDKVVTLSGTKGLNVYNASNLEFIKSISSWIDDAQEAKRTIDFAGDKVLISEGYQGLAVYSMTTGAKIQSIPLTPIPSADPDDVVTNAVSVNGDYVFAANGGNGLNVFKNGDQLTLMGTVGIEGSSNYVKTSGDYIYVASGKGGLKIIKMERPAVTPSACNGLPAYTGDANLNVNSGQTLAYSGTTALSWVNVNAALTLCGATTIQYDLNINNGGVFKMYGTLNQGSVGQWGPTNFHLNGEMQVEGKVIIWGNFTMNSGAKLTFLGNSSSITIYGKVTKNSGVTITGNYTDTENKLK